MCNLCSDTSPCLLSPGQCILFFLRVLSMGGSLIFELDVDSCPCILMHLWKRRREKEHLRNTCPRNLDCISFLISSVSKTLRNLLWQSSGINASIPNKGPCGTSSFAPKDPKTDLEGLSDLALGKNKDMHFQLACYP